MTLDKKRSLVLTVKCDCELEEECDGGWVWLVGWGEGFLFMMFAAKLNCK